MTNRRWLAKGLTLLMVAVLLLVTACSGGSQEAGTQNGEAGEKSGDSGSKAVKLSIMWWGPDARHEATMKVLDSYSKQHPGVTFTPEYLAWDGYWSKLPTLAASKSITDVLQMDAAYIKEYVGNGTLEDLSDIDLSGIVDPNVIENLKIDGKLYGIPLSQNAGGIAYNKEELEKHGIPLPHQNWTWDEYFDWAREARKKLPEGKYPIGDVTTWDGYQYYQAAYGKGDIMADGGKTFSLDKELFLKFFNTYAEFRKEKIVPPAEQAAAFLENDPQADPMASGVLMTIGKTTGSVSVLETLMPGKVDVVNSPTGPDGGGWAQSTIFLSVSSNSKHKQEAKDFVRWFITDKEAGQVLRLTRGIPINPDIYAELEASLEPKDKLGKKLYDVSVEKALPFFSSAAGYTEWVDAFEAEMENVVYGKQSVEQAYEKINQLGQDLAAKAASK